MKRFFNKIRLDALKKKKIIEYFKYSIGEIFLIVLGIIIALQINIWNEERKDEKYLQKVYHQMHEDLRFDTLYSNVIIGFYDQMNQNLVDIIDRKISLSYFDTINESNYRNCKKCNCGLIENHLFVNTNKGYQLFREINNNKQIDIRQDSLTRYLIYLYDGRINNIKDFGKKLYQLTDEAIKDYQDYNWYTDLIVYSKIYNKEYLKYIYESDEHRKKCATYLYYSANYVTMVKDYKKNATLALGILENKLKY